MNLRKGLGGLTASARSSSALLEQWPDVCLKTDGGEPSERSTKSKEHRQRSKRSLPSLDDGGISLLPYTQQITKPPPPFSYSSVLPVESTTHHEDPRMGPYCMLPSNITGLPVFSQLSAAPTEKQVYIYPFLLGSMSVAPVDVLVSDSLIEFPVPQPGEDAWINIESTKTYSRGSSFTYSDSG